MVGDDIPELPPPPQKVLQNFSKKKQEQLTRRDPGGLTSGSGLAFGLSLAVTLKLLFLPSMQKLELD